MNTYVVKKPVLRALAIRNPLNQTNMFDSLYEDNTEDPAFLACREQNVDTFFASIVGLLCCIHGRKDPSELLKWAENNEDADYIGDMVELKMAPLLEDMSTKAADRVRDTSTSEGWHHISS